MPIQQRARYRILSSLLDTSFGKSSMKVYPNHFVKMTMPLEGTIQIKCQVIANVGGSENSYIELRKRMREELLKSVAVQLKSLTERYKQAVKDSSDESLLSYRKQPHEEPAQATIDLKLDQSSIQEWIEHVSMSAYRTNKTVLYHLHCVANVS